MLAVSESGYYRSLKPSPKQERQQLLLVKIKSILTEHEDNRNYGVRRILLALSQIEITTSYSTVYRIMKQHGLLKKVRRHPNGITREDAAAQKSENLIQRNFKSSAPPEVAVGYHRDPLFRRQAISLCGTGLFQRRDRGSRYGRQYAQRTLHPSF